MRSRQTWVLHRKGPSRLVWGKNSLTRYRLALFALVYLAMLLAPGRGSTHAQTATVRPNAYVGSLQCKACHQKEYLAFTAYAKKSSSFESINRLRGELTEEEVNGCYSCHTTGYGKPGGFISEGETPHLKNAGCEVCHGPGQLHVETQDPADIRGHLTEKDCETCHTSERVKAFRYKPLIRGGAH